jgi:hypothetical protein
VVIHVSRAIGGLRFTRSVVHRGRGLGPDIHVADGAGHQFIIEAKGERGGLHRSSAMDTDIYIALGQLVTRFQGGHRSGKNYGLAFPSSFRQRLLGKLTPQCVRLLSLHCFFVNSAGKVDHVGPRELRALVISAQVVRQALVRSAGRAQN